MSLTQEQEVQLRRLNEVFRKFESRLTDDPASAELLVQQFMMEEFPLVSPNKAHMQKLADMRKSLLSTNTSKPIQKMTDNGDFQLSFE
jgi:hypothetical protein